jgi:hypothetical protein
VNAAAAAVAAGMRGLVLGHRGVTMAHPAHHPMPGLTMPVQRDVAGILPPPEWPDQALIAHMIGVGQDPRLRRALGAVSGDGAAMTKPTAIVSSAPRARLVGRRQPRMAQRGRLRGMGDRWGLDLSAVCGEVPKSEAR